MTSNTNNHGGVGSDGHVAFALGRGPDGLLNPGPVVVFEPDVVLVELHLLQQFPLLVISEQEIGDQPVECFEVLAVALQCFAVVFLSKDLVLLGLVALGKEQVLEASVVVLLLAIGQRVVDVAHRDVPAALQQFVLLDQVLLQHVHARLHVARGKQSLSHQDSELLIEEHQLVLLDYLDHSKELFVEVVTVS